MKKHRQPRYAFCGRTASENRSHWQKTTNDIRLSTDPKKATARAVTNSQGLAAYNRYGDCNSWHYDKDAE